MSFHTRLAAATMFAVAALSTAASMAGTNEWTIKGPPGGTFRSVQASSTAPNVFYAAYLRSLHRSTDGGVSWTTVRGFDGQMNGLAVDPTDGNRVYVSAGQQGLFCTEDGGQTFTKVAPAMTSNNIWGVGANATTVYYSTNSRSFHRSTDRGQTWEVRSTAPQVLTRILVDPQDADVIYAVAGPYLERSIDGGATWTQTAISPVSSSIYGMTQLSTTQLIAALGDGLYASSDRGQTWTNTASGWFRDVVADRATPGRAVALKAHLGPLLRTTDYGSSWSSFGATPTGSIQGISIDSQSSLRMVALSQQGAQSTANEAQSWVEASPGPIASSTAHFATTLTDASRVYMYTGAGDVYATSGDSGWQRLNLAAVQAVYFSSLGQARLAVTPGNANSLYFGTFSGHVFRSLDGGTSWSGPNLDLSGFSVQAFGFDPNDANVIYTQVYGVTGTPVNGLYRSTDGGASWSPHSTNLGTDIFGMDLQIDPADGTRMFLAAYQGYGPPATGGLYSSTDRGVTWNQTFTGEDVRTIAISPENSSRMYVATSSGLQMSTDGGASFTPNNQFAIITGQTASSVAVDPVVPTTMYAASLDPGYGLLSQASSYVLRSVDRGQTWEVLRSGSESPAWYTSQLALDPNNPSLLYINTGSRGVASIEIAPDLALELSGHSGARPMNVESNFQLRAVNNGPYAATSVQLSATMPAGVSGISATADRGTCTAGIVVTCSTPVLRVGEEINVVVSYTPPGSMPLPITATVSAHERDSATANNFAEASAITGEVVNLRVAITPSATTVVRGSNITYAVNVTNAGPSLASAGTLTFSLASGFTLGNLPDGCTASGGTVSCGIGELALGGSQAFSFPAVATEAGSTAATAAVSAATSAFEMDGADNTAAASVTATSPPPADGGGSGGGGGGSSGGGGGGGGAINLGALFALLGLLGVRRRRARLAQSAQAT